VTALKGLRHRLTQGPPILATFCVVPSPDVVEIAILGGLDAVIIDCEHGPISTETAAIMTVAAHSRGGLAIVRVRRADPSLIGAALDLGADGVLVPQIASVGEARVAINAARFAPDGNRGANPFVRAADFGANEAWFSEANASAAVLLMVEGSEGLAAVPSILELPGLDCVFLGPVDISHSLGVPGETEHPRVIAAMEDVVRQSGAKGVAVGAFTHTPAGALRWFARGLRLVAVSTDSKLTLDTFKDASQSARK
jgi:4-hydroxy-2-oxoheptanedioate aldolase